MNENGGLNYDKEADSSAIFENLKNKNISIEMYISRDKMIVGIASLMVAGFGFLIAMLGILGTIWFYHISTNYLWWIVPIIAIIFTFCLLVPLMEIDKTRRKCEQKCLAILRKN